MDFIFQTYCVRNQLCGTAIDAILEFRCQLEPFLGVRRRQLHSSLAGTPLLGPKILKTTKKNVIP